MHLPLSDLSVVPQPVCEPIFSLPLVIHQPRISPTHRTPLTHTHTNRTTSFSSWGWKSACVCVWGGVSKIFYCDSFSPRLKSAGPTAPCSGNAVLLQRDILAGSILIIHVCRIINHQPKSDDSFQGSV